jgi:tetratricopeptide (TPR) repeat protein
MTRPWSSLVLSAGFLLAAMSCVHQSVRPENPQLRQFREAGHRLFLLGQFSQAEEQFRSGLDLARKVGDGPQALVFLNNLGASKYVVHSYRAALAYYQEAVQVAEQIRDFDKRDGTLVNIAAIYAQQGDAGKAIHLAERAFAEPRSRNSPYQAQILAGLGIFQDIAGNREASDRAFRQSVMISFERGDRMVESRAAMQWGMALLQRGELETAERMLERSLAIQILDRGFERGLAELGMARLRLRQNRSSEALHHANESVRLAGRSGHDPQWMAHVVRAQVQLSLRDWEASRADYRKALEWARRWRTDALPVDRMLAGAERMLRDIPAGFAEIARRTGRREDAVEALTVFEESRRNALRALAVTSQQRRGALPGEYQDLLARVPLLEARTASSGRAELAREAESLRARLALLEARHAPAIPPAQIRDSASFLHEIQMNLSPDETLLIYAVLPAGSFGWGITRKTFEMRVLPGADWFAERVRCARAFHGEESTRCATELSQKLFGEFSPEIPTNTFWTLVLDGVLAELPLAALPTPGSSGVLASADGARNEGRMYLAESHRLSIVPWAVPHARAARPAPRKGEVSLTHFAGYGDPIYNRADIRWRSRAAAPQGLLAFWSTTASLPSTLRLPAVELPRLAGSGREVLRSASIWEKAGARNTVLLGEEANRARLVAMLEDHPDILHLGTHVIVPGAEEPAPLLVLGLDPSSGEVQLLDAAAIASGPQAPRMVVLSGCRSMGASLIDGKGVQSLVRAWIAGGAEAVLASHWVIPDDDGEFFVHFYRALVGSDEAEPMRRRLATALQRAQRALIASGGWRRDPRHWAAWQATVRE